MDVIGNLVCGCPDYELRQQPCKQVIAVKITVKRGTVAPDGTITETKTVRMTYPQNWAAYNAAQCEEKDRFIPMLARPLWDASCARTGPRTALSADV